MSSLWPGADLSSQQAVACKFENVSLQSWNLSSRTLIALLHYNFKMTIGGGPVVTGIKERETKVSQLLTEEPGSFYIQFSLDQSTTSANPNPSIVSVNSLPSVLSEAMQKTPVDQLHLDTTAHNALVEEGIATIGELYNANTEYCYPYPRGKIESAVLFLNEENADIGLFLLSKEFEATLKAFLIAADAKGKLQTHPTGKTPDKWNLNSRVERARENRIITDNAVFHYLRQARNDRAHGTMPSLEERRLLMKSVLYVAGLYIDYIKVLDALSLRL